MKINDEEDDDGPKSQPDLLDHHSKQRPITGPDPQRDKAYVKCHKVMAFWHMNVRGI